MRNPLLLSLTFAMLPAGASAETPTPDAPAPPVAEPSPTGTAPAETGADTEVPPGVAPSPAPSAPTADVVAAPAAPAAPAATPWKFGIAPRIGAAIPTSKLGTSFTGGIELDFVTAALEHRLVIGADLSLARPSYDSSVMDPRIPGGATTYTVHETEMVIGATIGYRVFTADHALVPWAAIGPVLHLLRTSESTMLSPSANTAESTELGLELAGGADYRTGPGYVIGGLRMVYSNLDHRLTGDSNAGKLAIEVGYRFVF